MGAEADGVSAVGVERADGDTLAEAMLARDLESHRAAQDWPGIVFFDRGLTDVPGYLRLEGLPIPDHMRQAAAQFRYNARVFIAPPWPEIFTTDAERKQTPEVALRTYEAMVETYGALGYILIELPRVSVEERVRFILSALPVARCQAAEEG